MKEILMLSDNWSSLEPLLIPVGIFWIVNKLLDRQPSKWFIQGVEKMWNNLPRWKQKMVTEYIQHHRKMENHNQRLEISGRISNIVTLMLFVLLAGNMYIYAVAFFSLTIVSNLSDPSVLKLTSGLVLTYLMRQLARYYRADAYNLAGKYHINLYPWWNVKKSSCKK